MRDVTEKMASIFNGILKDEDDGQLDPPKEKPKTVHILPAAYPQKLSKVKPKKPRQK